MLILLELSEKEEILFKYYVLDRDNLYGKCFLFCIRDFFLFRRVFLWEFDGFLGFFL